MTFCPHLLKLKIKSYATPSKNAISQVIIAFTDANKTNFGLIIMGVNHTERAYIQLNHGSVQLGKLLVVLKVLEMTQSESINIFSVNHYTTQACKILSFAKLKSQNDFISKTMQTIQDLLQSRIQPWHISHIMSQVGLPGMLATGNHKVDRLILI